MKIGTALRWMLLALLLAAGAAQYLLVKRVQAGLDQLAARLIAHGELRYQRVWPFLWGGGRVWGLSFAPEGVLRVSLHAEPGLRVVADEVRVRRLRWNADGELTALHGSAYGLRVPLSHIHGIGASGPDALPMPSPSELGVEALDLDLDFRLEYVDASELAMAQFTAIGDELGRLHLETRLEGSRATLVRAPEYLQLRGLRLDWVDGGLGQRFRDVAAARARLSRAGWEQAMLARLDERARSERWTWDADSLAALRRLVPGDGGITLRLDPPADVVLRNLRLYHLPDWPAVLGFELATGAGFEHPLPARSWP